MRFVHREETDRRLSKRFYERSAAEALRRDVNEFVIAARQTANALLLLGRAERTIDQVAAIPRRSSAST